MFIKNIMKWMFIILIAHILDFNYNKTKINFAIYLNIMVLTLTAF